MTTPIESNEQYFEVADSIERFLKKATSQGSFDTLTDEENTELHRLSVLASQYEKEIKLMPVRQPLTLPEAIQLKMFQMHLSQKELARLLEVPESRISEVMNGKRKINIELARRLHTRLKMDADFILMSA